MSPLPFEPPPPRNDWAKIVGQLIADLTLGGCAGAIVAVFGGPGWAAVATGYIVFSVWRCANYVVGMGRRGWR